MKSSCPKKRFQTDLLLAFLLPAAVFLLILAHFRILPFGETTLLFSDLDTQYVEFMAEYRRILLGEGSLTWSWNAGLGMNFLAIIAYYLASPFNFLLIFFPENGLPLAVFLLTLLKLGSAGMAFAYFLKQRERMSQNELLPVFAAGYALSTYAMGYSFNIMWLDAMIWLPLLCAAADRILDEGPRGMTGLTLLFALSFLSQFYMAWMTGGFCALYFLTGLVLRKLPLRNLLRAVLKFAICVGIAAGLSAFLLLPTFLVLKNNMGLMGQEFPPFTGGFDFPSLLKMLFAGSFDWIKDCLPHVYGGLFMLIGLVHFFLSDRISKREKAVSGILGAFLLFSFWFRPLDFLWHAMDHPSWFPYRYAFLFTFWGLSSAFRGFLHAGPNRNRLISIAICMILLLFARVADPSPDSLFLLINAGLLAAYALASFPSSFRVRLLLFTLIASAELWWNGGTVTEKFADRYAKLSDFRDFHDHYRDLAAPLLPGENDFYRMEKTAIRNYNDPLGIGFPGVSHFSSTASTRQTRFLKQLGFNCYASWCTYQGSTAFTDALLGIRYEFGSAGKTDSVSSGPETWEHPSQFPLFFFASEDYSRYDLFSDKSNPVQRQNELLALLDGTGKADYFGEIPLQLISSENLEDADDGTFLRTDPDRPAYAEAEIGPVSGKSVYLYLEEASLSYSVYAGEDQLMNGNSDYAPFLICLDAYTQEDSVHVRIETLAESISGQILAYGLDTDRLSALSERISASAPQLERNGNTSFLLTAEPSEEDRLVVSSIPFDAGWQVTVNGKKIPLKMIHESVLGFILPAGSGNAVISYRPYGGSAGLLLSGCALLMWLFFLIIEMKKNRRTVE